MDSSSQESEISKLPPSHNSSNIQSVLDDYELEFTADGKLIRWSASNKNHPRNWSTSRKLLDSSLLGFFDLFTTAISTAGSTTADHAAEQFGIGRTLSIFFFVSLYLIGQCIGATIFPSYSEAFGRKQLYIISTSSYCICCIIVGVVPHVAGVAVGRFFSGFMSAIPTIIVAGSIEDMFNSKDRVWLIYVWALVSNMGLTLGPVMSTYITVQLGWKWVYYVAASVTAIISLALIFIRESRPSLLLEREVAKVRKETGISTLKALNPDHTPDLRTFARQAFFRPVQLFFTEPIVCMVSIMSAVAFAIIYLFTEALPLVYEAMGFSEESSSLPFIAMFIGLLLGLLTRIKDYHTILKHEAQNITLEPEAKLLGFSIGAPMLAGGLWLFAWTIPPLVPNVNWAVSAIGLVLVGYACNEFDAVLAGYLADSYLTYAASGYAALAMLRSLMSGAFPLFAQQMFDGLGSNVAASIIAAVATVFCIVPPIFTRYGKRIRARSKFARYSLEVYQENGVDTDGY